MSSLLEKGKDELENKEPLIKINLRDTKIRYLVFTLSCIYTLGVYVSDDLPAILEN